MPDVNELHLILKFKKNSVSGTHVPESANTLGLADQLFPVRGVRRRGRGAEMKTSLSSHWFFPDPDSVRTDERS